EEEVHRSSFQLGQTQLEPAALERVPGDPRLDRDVLVVDAAVARDQVEAQLPDVASLDVDDLGGDQVVVEEAHRVPSLPGGGVVAVPAGPVEPGAAPGAPAGACGVPLPEADEDARPRRPPGGGVAPGVLLARDRARRAGAQLADRCARRAALLLHAHDPACADRRPRAALLHARAD